MERGALLARALRLQQITESAGEVQVLDLSATRDYVLSTSQS